MAYHLEGRLLEVCDCRVLCPCWIGEDPDYGTCDTIVAWRFDKGTWTASTSAGRTIAMVAHVPGNILQGNWTAAIYLDDGASRRRKRRCSTSTPARTGGPVADLAKLIGKVVSVQKVPITFTVQGGSGTIKVGDAGYAQLEPYKSAAGEMTTLTDTVFSTVPGAPVFVGKAPELPLEEHAALAGTSTSRATTRCRAPSCSTPERPWTGRAMSALPQASLAAPREPRRDLRPAVLLGGALGGGVGRAVGLGASPVRPLPRPRRLDRHGRARRPVPRAARPGRSSCRPRCTPWRGC